MRQACRRGRALRAVLGLAIVLALGFAVDALVLVTTRAAPMRLLPRALRRGGNRPWPERAKIERSCRCAASQSLGKMVPRHRARRSSGA